MRRIIGLNDNLEDLADKVLLDASAILPSLRSRRSLRKSDLRKRHKASKKLIGRLLDTNTRKGMCYTTPTWDEVHGNVMDSGDFSTEKYKKLKGKMSRTDKAVYEILLPGGWKELPFEGLKKKLKDQKSNLNVNDRAVIRASLSLGIPTIVTYDDGFFDSRQWVSKCFRKKELKRRDRRGPNYKVNNYSVLTPKDALICLFR